MAAINTGSITDASEGRNTTRTGLSTLIVVKVGDNAVGAIKSLNLSQARRVTMIDEVGTDGHIDSAPSQSTNITGSCSRTRFDGLGILPAFSRGYIHVHAQRLPFNIDIIDLMAGSDPASQLVTTIVNVWVTQLDVTYRSDDFIIVDDMRWEAETIRSTLGANSNAVPGAAGSRNLVIPTSSPFERAADRGDRRGSIDAAGLLNAIDEA